jgi:predicted acetyltransferase
LMFPRMSDDDWATREGSWIDSHSVTAWDGARCVGHAGAFPFDTTVPGGNRLPTSGVTRVGVLTTHRRQGVLNGMMTRLLEEARDRGQVLASLRASEAVIYERYGFGMAAEAAGVRIRPREAGTVLRPAEGSMRILERDEILDVAPAVYDRYARRRVGTVSRPSYLWTRYLDDALTGKKASFVAVHEDSTGTPDGYVHYSTAWGSDETTGKGEVEDLFGADDAVERALWQYVLSVDLVTEWTAGERPVDDPIRHALTNRRAYWLTSRWDEQWLRVIDLDVALGARTYRACDRSVTIQVTDPILSANNGTWRIDAYGAFRSHGDADLQVDVTTMGAAYLGGTSWRELADAGRVRARSQEAVDDADTLFATRPHPFCGTFF